MTGVRAHGSQATHMEPASLRILAGSSFLPYPAARDGPWPKIPARKLSWLCSGHHRCPSLLNFYKGNSSSNDDAFHFSGGAYHGGRTLRGAGV